MKNKILVIEDSAETTQLICTHLENSNFAATSFDSAEKAFEKLQTGYLPDLLILDSNLPKMNGFDFLKKFREDYKKTIPAVIVSESNNDEDIIKGFECGADDFVTKPFNPDVLVAKVKARLNRLAVIEASVEETISFGSYTLFFNSCVLKRGAERVPLSTKEYEVLEFLARNEEKPLTPKEIYSNVWKTQFGELTAVAVYIQRLRKKIEDDPSKPKYITTIFGMGYKFSR